MSFQPILTTTSFSATVDPERLAALVRSPQGPVVRKLMTIADVVKQAAREQVGYSDTSEDRTHSASGDAGHLRDRILTRVVQDEQGVAVEVGAEHPLAYMHHEGTDPHPIEPVNGKFLHFVVDGMDVFALHVDHPGTQPNRYLTDQIPIIQQML